MESHIAIIGNSVSYKERVVNEFLKSFDSVSRAGQKQIRPKASLQQLAAMGVHVVVESQNGNI